MALFFIISVFILGTIIGSFLNAIIFRYNTGRSLVGSIAKKPERSICMSCSKHLAWFELVPIVSFLIQKGKCLKCRSKISPQYPIVEFITGLAFVLIFFHELDIAQQLSAELFLNVVFSWLIWSILIMIGVYDARHKIIPNKPVYTFIILALLFSGLFNLFAGIILALPFALIWLFSKGRLMGLGDAKLILGIGFLLGLNQGLTTLLFAFWIGAVVSLLLIALSRTGAFLSEKVRITMKSEIPFGPFLIIAAFIVYLFDLNMASIIHFFIFK